MYLLAILGGLLVRYNSGLIQNAELLIIVFFRGLDG